MLHRTAHGQGAIVANRLLAVNDRILVQIAPEKLAAGEDDGFFLGSHGDLAEMVAPPPLPFAGKAFDAFGMLKAATAGGLTVAVNQPRQPSDVPPR